MKLLLAIAGIFLWLFDLTAAPDPPTIYALIVGVTDYGGLANLTHAAPNAIKVAGRIESVFGIKPDLLLDSNATKEAIEERLEKTVEHLPPNSLFIFYFAGHGIKNDIGSGPGGVESYRLFMRLKGSTSENYVGSSIKSDVILSILRAKHRLNSLIFLDCCYSGAATHVIGLGILDTELKAVSAKAMFVTSSGASQTSTYGMFTDALLEVWKSPTCLTPDAMITALDQKVTEMNPNMVVVPVIRPGIQRCWISLNEPSTVLLLSFSRKPKQAIRLYFDGSTNLFERIYQDEGFVLKQIPRREVQMRAMIGNVVLTNCTLKPAIYQNGYTTFRINIPEELCSAEVNDTELTKTKEVFDALQLYGLTTATAALAAAQYHTLQTGLPHGYYLAMAQRLEPDNEIFQIANLDTDSKDVTSRIKQVASSNEVEEMGGDILRSVGKHDLALMVFIDHLNQLTAKYAPHSSDGSRFTRYTGRGPNRSAMTGGRFQPLTQTGGNNVEYFIGFSAGEENPQTILSGDRNLALDPIPTYGIHSNPGNVLLADGSVVASKKWIEEMQRAFTNTGTTSDGYFVGLSTEGQLRHVLKDNTTDLLGNEKAEYLIGKPKLFRPVFGSNDQISDTRSPSTPHLHYNMRMEHSEWGNWAWNTNSQATNIFSSPFAPQQRLDGKTLLLPSQGIGEPLFPLDIWDVDPKKH